MHESELPPTGYAKIMITEDGQPAVLKAGAFGEGLGLADRRASGRSALVTQECAARSCGRGHRRESPTSPPPCYSHHTLHSPPPAAPCAASVVASTHAGGRKHGTFAIYYKRGAATGEEQPITDICVYPTVEAAENEDLLDTYTPITATPSGRALPKEMAGARRGAVRRVEERHGEARRGGLCELRARWR